MLMKGTPVCCAMLLALCLVSSGLAEEPHFTTIDVPGAADTGASGINARGDIVGDYNRDQHGYLLSKGHFTTIDVPGASATAAFAITAAGDIVGDYSTTVGPCAAQPSAGCHGFLLSKGTFTTIDV